MVYKSRYMSDSMAKTAGGDPGKSKAELEKLIIDSDKKTPEEILEQDQRVEKDIGNKIREAYLEEYAGPRKRIVDLLIRVGVYKQKEIVKDKMQAIRKQNVTLEEEINKLHRGITSDQAQIQKYCDLRDNCGELLQSYRNDLVEMKGMYETMKDDNGQLIETENLKSDIAMVSQQMYTVAQKRKQYDDNINVLKSVRDQKNLALEQFSTQKNYDDKLLTEMRALLASDTSIVDQHKKLSMTRYVRGITRRILDGAKRSMVLAHNERPQLDPGYEEEPDTTGFDDMTEKQVKESNDRWFNYGMSIASK